jgi:Ca-activated chloride channel family protein
MFEIAYPWVFWLAPLPMLVYWILPSLKLKRSALIYPNIQLVAERSNTELKKSAWVSKRNIMQWLILWLIWGCGLAALSSPQLVGEPEMKIKTARSLVIAADISFSMAARDWEIDGERKTRWEAVRSLLEEFIETRAGDRLALIFFGSNAYLQAPLTTDLEIVKGLLSETDVGMAGQMTSIGAAIGFGVQLFKKDTLKQKVMLLLTDGVDAGQGVAPLDAASLAKSDSIKIYTLGIGDPSLPGADLDENALKKIAAVTGGEYFLAIDSDQMEAAYEALNALEPIEFEEENYKPVTRLFYYPLLVALALSFFLMFLRIIGNTLKNWKYND